MGVLLMVLVVVSFAGWAAMRPRGARRPDGAPPGPSDVFTRALVGAGAGLGILVAILVGVFIAERG